MNHGTVGMPTGNLHNPAKPKDKVTDLTAEEKEEVRLDLELREFASDKATESLCGTAFDAQDWLTLATAIYEFMKEGKNVCK